MRNLITTVLFLMGLVAFGQQPPSRQSAPVLQAKEQPAQSITIALGSDLATSLETMRLNTLGPEVQDKTTGVVTRTPVYATVQQLVDVLVRDGIFRQVVARFPSPSVRASQDVAAKAKAEADALAGEAVK